MSEKARPLGLTMLKAIAIGAALASLLAIYLPDLPMVGKVFYPFY